MSTAIVAPAAMPHPLHQLTPNHHLPFVKMHGLGNDFVMLDYRALQALSQQHGLPSNHWEATLPALTRTLCHRFTGIGADGLIVAAPPSSDAAVARFIYFNADGTVAEMCGNGIRCFATYLHHTHWTEAITFTVNSLAGDKTLTLTPEGLVTVNMGPPVLAQQHIPATVNDVSANGAVVQHPITAHGATYPITLVNMGNPHAVLLNGPTKTSAPQLGPTLETHTAFPDKINVEFATINTPNHITLDVWERGCGWTQACGTGACATVVAAKLAGVTPNGDGPITVTLPGGDLHITWQAPTAQADGTFLPKGDVSQLSLADVWMTGPAQIAFTGTTPLANHTALL